MVTTWLTKAISKLKVLRDDKEYATSEINERILFSSSETLML